MFTTDHSGIKQLFQVYSHIPQVAELQHSLDEMSEAADLASLYKLIALYQKAIPVLEHVLWVNGVDASQLSLYQRMFQQMEQLHAACGGDDRYSFVVIIPVADRPQHLSSCIDSLFSLCEIFNYGGLNQKRYSKIQVIIADDSKLEENIRAHKLIAQQATDRGLYTEYFGQREQIEQLDKIGVDVRGQLTQVLGNIDKSRFYHKGASIMRNITYLKLNEMSQDADRLLFYFIDSDQEFRVKIQSVQGEQDVYVLNYFYHLNDIFTRANISVLTGKVVGDPPVSPAVMAGNFLDDVIGFLQQIAETKAEDSCQFHKHKRSNVEDASYHDMADLFGFNNSAATYRFHCMLENAHTHIDCFHDFAEKLNHFFYGEHPTRKSYYEYEAPFDSIRPARTVYTGNYIFKPEALGYFIPFATLKLRMAGPVLGRIIKSEISDKFISANLPMLHKRTLEENGQSEFRPGVEHKPTVIDLSGEFERQFYGDIVLFTMEKLTESGYPENALSEDEINSCLYDVEQDLYQKYETKHRQIMDKLSALKTIFTDKANWWNKHEHMESAINNFNQFIINIEYNFGEFSDAYKLVADPVNMKLRKQQILTAIRTYIDDRYFWDKQILAKDE